MLLAVISVAIFAVGVWGCKTVTDYTAYRNEDFRAEVTGDLYGVPFSAVIEAENGGKELSVSYLSSDPLEGIVVALHADGTATVTREEVVIVCEKSAVSGLLSPVLLLFDTGDIGAVRKEGERTRLSFAGGGEMLLSSDMHPMRVDHGDVLYEVVWWEITENAQTG